MSVVLYREESAADRAAVFAVHAAAFPTNVEARLVDELRSAGDVIVSMVAESGGRVAGSAVFSRMSWDREPAPVTAGLGPVAVSPDWQRQGVGAELIQRGLALCRDRGVELVFVLGEPAYYGRFGFRVELAAQAECRYAGPHLQALDLRAGCTPPRGACVRYAAAFERLLTARAGVAGY